MSALGKLRARRRKKLADKRGVALVMVLGAITVLTVFLTELQEETSSELSAALSERDALKAEYIARSAVNLSRLLIAVEPQIRKSIPLGLKTQIPVWAFTDMVLGPFNNTTEAESFNSLINADTSTSKNIGLEGGHFELKIIDEDSKMNLNIAARGDPTSLDKVGRQLMAVMQPPSYNTLFEQVDGDGQHSDRQTICGAIVDWADDNDFQYPCIFSETNIASGAENNDYQILGLNYQRRNAPFDSLEELRLVRGVGDDFWATFVDPDPNDPSKRVMTVWGQDKINANTANAMTLLGLVCTDTSPSVIEFCNDPVQLMTFIQAVSMVRQFTMGAPLFQTKAEFVKAMKGEGTFGMVLGSLGIKPLVFKAEGEINKQIGLKSQLFSIYADGVIPGYRRTTKVRIHAVVDFRSASDVGNPAALLGGQMPNATPQPGAPASTPQTAGQVSPVGYEQMVTASAAGKIVYWRIE